MDGLTDVIIAPRCSPGQASMGAITAEASVWVPQRRMGVTGFDWLIENQTHRMTSVWTTECAQLLVIRAPNTLPRSSTPFSRLRSQNCWSYANWQIKEHEIGFQKLSKYRRWGTKRLLHKQHMNLPFVPNLNWIFRRPEVASNVFSGMQVTDPQACQWATFQYSSYYRFGAMYISYRRTDTVLITMSETSFLLKLYLL